MNDEEFVKSIYPTANLITVYIGFPDEVKPVGFRICLNEYPLSLLIHETEMQAWEYAKRKCMHEFLEKINS
jgi:hypothetical protein